MEKWWGLYPWRPPSDLRCLPLGPLPSLCLPTILVAHSVYCISEVVKIQTLIHFLYIFFSLCISCAGVGGRGRENFTLFLFLVDTLLKKNSFFVKGICGFFEI